MTERIQGPVNSAITQLLQHFEVAMWAEGVDPEATTRVLNLVTFGNRSGGPSGTVKGLPEWAEAIATEVIGDIHDTLEGTAALKGSKVADDLKLVVLALVRQVLQGSSGPIEQALTDPGGQP